MPNEIKLLRRKINNCHECDIALLCNHKVILSPRDPPLKPDILFVGEAPGESEYICKEPFVGRSGELLREIASEIEPGLSHVYTNAVLCTPFIDEDLDEVRTPLPSEVRSCSKHLNNLINYLRPKHIVAVGKIAERTLKFLGHPHTTILHPSNMLRGSHQELEMQRAVLKIRLALSKR